jgi:phenylacetic acid degradation operon negative regulatory protein
VTPAAPRSARRPLAPAPPPDRTLFGPVSTSQRLLFTLLGDYWWNYPGHIPSAALVALLAEFGVSEAGARAALSRVSRSGVLEGLRVGRTTWYRLTPAARRWGRNYGRTVARFTGVGGTGPHDEPWDGTWTCVTYSVPEDERDTRRAVRARLRALGFGPLHDAVWVSPRASAGAGAEAGLTELGVERFTVLRNAEVSGGSGIDPVAVWDLDELRATYTDLVGQLTAEHTRLKRRRTGGSPEAALITRTELMSAWRALSRVDPGLPADLLPRRWPAATARKLVVAVYDGLGPPAEERVRQIAEPWSAEAAAAAAHHPFAALT